MQPCRTLDSPFSKARCMFAAIENTAHCIFQGPFCIHVQEIVQVFAGMRDPVSLQLFSSLTSHAHVMTHSASLFMTTQSYPCVQ